VGGQLRAARIFHDGNKIGTILDASMGEAKSKKWVVISMKNDGKHFLAFEQ